jgi:VWFA-related protein
MRRPTTHPDPPEGVTMTPAARRAATLLMAGVVALAATAKAQEAQFAGEATVNIIELSVRVIDPTTGTAVTGLTKKDFRIFENGRAVKISNFEEIDRTGDSATAAAASRPSGTPPRPLEMVYFFDLYLMRKGERDRAVAALRERFQTSIPAGEEISIVAFDGSLTTGVDRTSDRRQVLDALDVVANISPRGMEHEAAFTQGLADGPVTGTRDRYFYERKQRSEEYLFELERRVARVAGALSATMSRYARADARKVLVAFTPGHPRTRWAPAYASVDFANDAAKYPTKGMWAALAAEASDLGFTLFTIDSSGIQGDTTSDVTAPAIDSVDRSSANAPPSGTTPPGAAAPLSDGNYAFGSDNRQESIGPWMERVRKDLLISAARDTGGQALFADPTTAVEEVSATLDHYYSVAYVADHSGDGNPHTIEVRLHSKFPYELEYRRTYVDLTPTERAATRLRSTMLFGGDANPLGVRIELGEPEGRLRIGAAGSKRVQLHVLVKIPIGRLEMVEQADSFIGRVAVTVFSEDAAGNQSEPASGIAPIKVPAREISQARARGFFSYDLTVELEGGRQKLWVGVEDLLSNRTSIMPQELDL